MTLLDDVPVRRARARGVRSRETERRYLTLLSKGHTLYRAASALDISYEFFLRWRRSDRDFAVAVEAAIEEGRRAFAISRQHRF